MVSARSRGATDGRAGERTITTASATGVGALTVSEWGSDPVTSPPFMASGQFFDVEVLSGSKFTTLVLKDCNLGGGTSLQWWNGTAWVDVVPDPPGFTYDDSGASPCLSGELSDTSSPTLKQLGGTIFAVTNAPVISLKKPKLKLAGARVTVRVHCARVACRGSATLRVAALKKANRIVLGRVKYRVRAGTTGSVRIALNARGKKALAHVTRSRAYKGTLTVTVAHGSTVTSPVRITR